MIFEDIQKQMDENSIRFAERILQYELFIRYCEMKGISDKRTQDYLWRHRNE